MARPKGIGGTDIAVIMGLNPWKSPMDLYLEKCGLVDSPEENEAMYWGLALEDALEKRYIRDTKFPVVRTEPLRHPEHDWYVGSPDGILPLADGKILGGVDYKTTSRRQDYGEAGTDQVPDWVATQAQWYMGLTGAEWWDIAVLFMGSRREWAIYRLPHNQEIIDNLIEAGRDFWENHIVSQIPPPLDSSEGTKKLLNILYPQEQGEIIPASPEAKDWLCQLQIAKLDIVELEKNKAFYEAHVKDAIGDNLGIVSDEWRATWKRNKDSTVTDWQKAYMDLCAYANYKGFPINDDDFSGKHTTIKHGARVLRVRETKIKEDL